MAELDLFALQKLSPTELGTFTKAELITAIVGNQRKTICTQSIDGLEGQALREFVTRDAAGAIIQTDKWIWTYQKSGEVNEITHIARDGKDTLLDASKIVQVGTRAELVALDLKEISAIEFSLPIKG